MCKEMQEGHLMNININFLKDMLAFQAYLIPVKTQLISLLRLTLSLSRRYKKWLSSAL